jgi:anti-anti-sigma regulatory factor
MAQTEYQITWDDAEKTRIVVKWRGRLTASDYMAAFEQSNEMMRQVNHTVDYIFDMTEVTSLDVHGLIKIAPRVNAESASNYGASIIVGMSAGARAVVDAAAHLAPRVLRSVLRAKTMEEARRISAERRAQPKLGQRSTNGLPT